MLRRCGLGLLALAFAAGAASAGNLVENGDFDSGRQPWVLFSDAKFSDYQLDSEGAKILIGPGGRNSQFYQAPIALDGGREYELTFYVAQRVRRAQQVLPSELDGPAMIGRSPHALDSISEKMGLRKTLIVAISQHGEPYENYGFRREIEMSRELKKFVFRFQTTAGDKPDARLRFAFPHNKMPVGYKIAGVSLRALNCGDGVLDAEEACDDGNNAAGDGCSATCELECQINYAAVDTMMEILVLAGTGICTADGDPSSDPQVFIGAASGEMVELALVGNDDTFIGADLSPLAPLVSATHRVVVVCPGTTKSVDVTIP